VYKGADLIPKALDCLQRQTFGNFEAIISVDGNDTETAAACRPFLVDPRFRMVVHPDRLDWIGNFNWLLLQGLKEFFCYRQHDDTTSPDFFEVLLRVADEEPSAAAVYCDCQLSGGRNDIEIVPSIKGEHPLDRIFQYISRLPNIGAPVPLRGLIRSSAIRQAGLVRSDEFRAAWQIFGWLASLLQWGGFRRVAEPLYYRLDHARSYTRQHWYGAHRAAWTTLFTGLLDAAMRACRTAQQRLFFQQVITDRIIAFPPFQGGNEYSSEKLVAECLERLKFEENLHLLDVKEFPSILHDLQRRVGKLKWIEASRLGRGISQIRNSYQFGKLIYPNSCWRRANYQIRRLVEILDKARRLVLRSALLGYPKA
jgi:glycosyltransferase involved in cell wall biosynthesis